MKQLILTLASLLVFSCTPNNKTVIHEKSTAPIPQSTKEEQEAIIKEHLENGAWTKGLFSQEWQEEIDKGLAKDSTIAYLWQQKAMPLYKQGKYELATKYIDQAVKYDRNQHQDYRAFMKCIFSKRYADAIADFEDCLKRRGNSYVMDHSYHFYIGLSKIMLNQFKEAEDTFEQDIANQIENEGEDWVHYLDFFYLGIAEFEQKKYEEAIVSFDKVLKTYPEFAEAILYKGRSFIKLGNKEEGIELNKMAVENGKKGYSVNEDNSIYERYPYQVRWELYN